MTRVAVTGWGVISPIGLNAPTYWSSLVAGRSGIGPITVTQSERLRQRIAAEIKDFDPLAHFTPERLMVEVNVTLWPWQTIRFQAAEMPAFAAEMGAIWP